MRRRGAKRLLRGAIRFLFDLPREEEANGEKPAWATWAKRRAAFYSLPTLSALYLITVVFRIHLDAIVRGWKRR